MFYENLIKTLTTYGYSVEERHLADIQFAALKDQEEEHQFRAEIDQEAEQEQKELPKEIQKGNKLLWLKNKLSDLYTAGLITENELEALEHAPNTMLQELGITPSEPDFDF